MSKSTMPEFVPHLTARDIHQGSGDGPNGTHCLIVWAMEAFKDGYVRHEIVWRELCRRTGVKSDKRLDLWNDNHTKSEVARVWNEVMAELGYTEVIDEDWEG